jgi:hypothetical protein
MSQAKDFDALFEEGNTRHSGSEGIGGQNHSAFGA